MPTYRGGASSLLPLGGDGWFSFSVPVDATAVYVGLTSNDISIDPSEHTHGFKFAGGFFRTVEGADAVGPGWAQHYSSDVFSLVRYADAVFYCRGQPGQTYYDKRVPFALPGQIIYASNVPRPGDVYLDAVLGSGGDRVLDAALTGNVVYAVTTSMSFAPMALAVGKLDTIVSMRFEPVQLQASQGTSIDMSFPFPAMSCGMDGGGVAMAFEPADVSSSSDFVSSVGAFMFIEPLAASASGPGAVRSDAQIDIAPLAVFAADNAAYAQAGMVFAPPSLEALGRHTGGAKFDVRVPALSGDLPVDAATADLESSAIALELLYPRGFALLESEAIASDLWLPGRDGSADIDSDAVADEWLSLSGIFTVEVEVIAEDSISFVAADTLSDEAVGDETALHASITSSDLAETAVAEDGAAPYVSADLADEAVGDESIQQAGVELLDGSALADDVLIDSSATAALLEDRADADDEALVQEVSSAELESVALAEDYALFKQTGVGAWVMNATTGAASWYDNWVFTSMATVKGRVFAAGPDGISIIGGDTDSGDAISARVDYGLLEFGGYDQTGAPKPSNYKKRVTGIWFGYHSDGAMQATVETYGQGYGQCTYKMDARKSAQPRNNRIIPGKGLNARYWRLSLENTQGCDFELHSIAVETATSTRRI